MANIKGVVAILVYIGGENDVTKTIAKKLVEYTLFRYEHESVVFEDLAGRSRGTGVLSKLPNMVELGKKSLVVFVFDSDGDCVVETLKKYCPDGWKSEFCAINIAIDEGESWLLADRAGFSKYFGIKLSDIPRCETGRDEIHLPYKTSLYIMKELVPKSSKKRVKENLQCTKTLKKPPTYNNLWIDYIMNFWNIEEALKKSKSLAKAVVRIDKIFQKKRGCRSMISDR